MKNKHIAEVPLKRVDEEVLTDLYLADPKDLRRMIRHAREQKPPNNEIIATIGGVAFVHMEEDGTKDYAKVVNEAFPRADVRAPGI